VVKIIPEPSATGYTAFNVIIGKIFKSHYLCCRLLYCLKIWYNVSSRHRRCTV